ncbi:MAG: EpsG family protein [Prevotella sp.]|nr:EpsG family protein [Prevotella sp.]
MFLYLPLLFAPLLAYVFLNRNLHQSSWLLLFYITILCAFVGFSDMLGGYDRYIYGELFDSTIDFIRNEGRIVDSIVFLQYSKEWGYVLINVSIGLFTTNRYIFILCLTILMYLLFFISIKRYATNYPLALVLFMGLMFFFTFTYLRQVIAVGFGSLAIKYVIERKLWKFLFFVLIAFSFHNSAIILLPLYFIPIKKYSRRTIMIVMSICLFLGTSGTTNILFGAFGGLTGTEERTAGYEEEIGFRIAYIMEASFFLFFLLKRYSQITNEKRQIVLYNMALIFCAILLFFIKSENGGRLSWFYIVGLITSLCNILDKKKYTFDTIILLTVSLFLYLRIIFAWGTLLIPYKTFFTNGVRENDAIYEKYEYDHNYATDKFYRDRLNK